MKVVVLGAGVIGVTSAWYLARAGHEVTVIDRQDGPALETSFANAGEVSPGYASPWAAPGIPLKAMKWLFMRHAPLIIQPRADWATISWMARMLSNCTAAYAVNKSRMVRLAEYSRDCLIDLRADTGIPAMTSGQGHLATVSHRKAGGGGGKGHQGAEGRWRAVRGAGCRWLYRRRTGSGCQPRQDRGRVAPAGG